MKDMMMAAVGLVILGAALIGSIAALIAFVRERGVFRALAVIGFYAVVIAALVAVYGYGPQGWQGVAALAAYVVFALFVVTLFAPLGLAKGLPLGLCAGVTVVLLADAYIPAFGRYLDASFGTLAPHEGTIDRAMDVVWGILFAPGVLAVGGVFYGWNALTGMAVNPLSDPGWSGLPRLVLFVFMGVVSWVGWSVALTRGLNFIGLWDPFAGVEERKRPRLLQWLVRKSYAWRERAFGKGPSAGWASIWEIMANRYLDGDIFLGRPRFMWRAIGLDTQRHMLTIAGTGGGKSTAALIPNLCLHEGSLLCIDPKGELANITAIRRAAGGNGVDGMGQEVYVLDPFGIAKQVPAELKAGYNVFDEMAHMAAHDRDIPVSYARKVAEALVKRGERGDAYWDNAAETLIRGLVLYVFVCEPPERRNLVRVRALLSLGDVEGYEALRKAGRLGEDMSATDVLLEKMAQAHSGPYGQVIAAAAESLQAMGENQRGSVLSIAQEHTVFLEDPKFAHVLTRSDFRLDDLKNERVSVYLCLPLNMVSGVAGRWLRMFVVLFIDMMMRVKEPPSPPVLLAIDEFAALGKVDGIETAAATLRSYGVRLWAVIQDLGQLFAVYGENTASSLFANTEAVQVLEIKHVDTVRLLSSLLGEHAVSVPTGGPHPARMEKPLLDAHQVMAFLGARQQNQIVWRGGWRPMKLKMTPYWEYLPSWYYAPDPDPKHKEKWRRSLWRWLRQPVGDVEGGGNGGAQVAQETEAATVHDAGGAQGAGQTVRAAPPVRSDESEAPRAEPEAPAVPKQAAPAPPAGLQRPAVTPPTPAEKEEQENLIAYLKMMNRDEDLQSYLKDLGREGEYVAILAGKHKSLSKDEFTRLCMQDIHGNLMFRGPNPMIMRAPEPDEKQPDGPDKDKAEGGA